MSLVQNQIEERPELSWPTDAQDAMSVLETAFPPMIDRRKLPRRSFRSEGGFETTDANDSRSACIYTRDANRWTLGFITSVNLETGLRGNLLLTMPDGSNRSVEARITRCREFIPGWYEASAEFANEESAFAA